LGAVGHWEQCGGVHVYPRRQQSDGQQGVPRQVLRFLSGVMTAPRLMNTSNDVGTVEPGRCVSTCSFFLLPAHALHCTAKAMPTANSLPVGDACTRAYHVGCSANRPLGLLARTTLLGCAARGGGDDHADAGCGWPRSVRPTRINFADTATAALLLGEKHKWDTCEACAYVGGAKAALAAHSIACSFAPVPPGLMRDIIRGQIEQQFPLPEGVRPSLSCPSRHSVLHALAPPTQLFVLRDRVAQLGSRICQS
jgi:hypothetical protein